jgi:dynactin complex subunit
MGQQADKQPLATARDKTDQVQRDLEVASAELGLTHGALERHLPPSCKKHGDVAWAMRQNAALERKVQQAAEELEEVTQLLDQARGAAGS